MTASSGVSPRGLAYRVIGSGPPLLWLGGYVVPARSLRDIVEAYARAFTCITFDHRGSGRSRPTLGPTTTARMARDAVDVLRTVGEASAHVYGISLGGMVAQELAIAHPERVRTLVLGATTAGGIDALAPPPRTLLHELRSMYGSLPQPGRVLLRGAMHQAWAAATHDAGPRLARVRVPTLVVHGERDRLTPLPNAERLAELIPGARLHVVRRAGHLYVFDATANADVLAWLLEHQDCVAPVTRPGAVWPITGAPGAAWQLARSQTLPARRSLAAITRTRVSGMR